MSKQITITDEYEAIAIMNALVTLINEVEGTYIDSDDYVKYLKALRERIEKEYFNNGVEIYGGYKMKTITLKDERKG